MEWRPMVLHHTLYYVEPPSRYQVTDKLHMQSNCQCACDWPYRSFAAYLNVLLPENCNAGSCTSIIMGYIMEMRHSELGLARGLPSIWSYLTFPPANQRSPPNHKSYTFPRLQLSFFAALSASGSATIHSLSLC